MSQLKQYYQLGARVASLGALLYVCSRPITAAKDSTEPLPLFNWLTVIAVRIFAITCALYLWLLSWAKSSNVSQRQKIFASLSIANSVNKTIVGFFHPYCNAGGGGERVLWTAVAYIQRTQPNTVCVVYTGDTDATKSQIIEKAQARFGISLQSSTLAFVYLKSRYLVDDKTWSRFTLIGQSLGSMWLAIQAIRGVIPDIFVDSMGYAFTYPVIRFFRLRPTTTKTIHTQLPILAYVHYPTISTDMLQRVRTRQATYNNSSTSSLKSRVKLTYYKIFAQLYLYSLSIATKSVANSTWTKDHVDSLLSTKGTPNECQILYPPCDTKALQAFPIEKRENYVLSVAQFRPEKDHATQVQALSTFLTAHPEFRSGAQKVQLVLLGSARNDSDLRRVEALKSLSRNLKIDENVTFVLNAPYDELLAWLGRASVGISTMVDEHFGINIVEYMAAGLIPLVHRSGGPLHDIVVGPTGFHATSSEEYADTLYKIFGTMREGQRKDMRIKARQRSRKFSEAEFENGWAEAWKVVAN